MIATDPDRALLQRAREGDYRAFAALVDRHSDRLFGLAMHIVRQREDAEDVLQTTLLSALEHLEDFREEAAFGTWLTRIAANHALKVLRKRRGLDVISFDGDGVGGGDGGGRDSIEGAISHPEFIADWRESPLETLERDELARTLDSAMAELPEGQRLVFVLRDLQGLSIEETTATLGISEGNVKVRLLRARLALRERLTRLFGDETRRLAPRHGHEHGPDRGAGADHGAFRDQGGTA